MKEYTVWVGGIEVNDYYLSKKEAKVLALSFEDYDDVVIDNINVTKNK